MAIKTFQQLHGLYLEIAEVMRKHDVPVLAIDGSAIDSHQDFTPHAFNLIGGGVEFCLQMAKEQISHQETKTQLFQEIAADAIVCVMRAREYQKAVAPKLLAAYGIEPKAAVEQKFGEKAEAMPQGERDNIVGP